MVVRLLSLLGWVLAALPESLLRAAARAGGEAAYALLPGRRRVMLSNLHHAFPGRSAQWRRRVARTCSCRVVETGLLSLATPHLPPERIRGMARLSGTATAWALALSAHPHPAVLATLHLALWESQTWLKLISPTPLPEFGIIFRPLDHPAADAYVRQTRERFGMRLLSRRDGFAQALQILRGGGCVGVLVDQNAGMQGALTLFFDRVCSTTDLPGLLTAKFGAEARMFYPRRTGFWRVEFECVPLPNDGTATGVTLALNRWLEAALVGDEDLCASWLWGHNRWRHQDVPASRLRLESKRNLLSADLAARGLRAMPKRTRIWIRLPNWLGDVMMAAPLVRALRHSRPDAEITLIGRGGFEPLVSSWPFADRFIALPPRTAGYFGCFLRLRHGYPDIWIALAQSPRADIEGWLCGAPQRFGLVRPGHRRPLLTHSYRLPPGSDLRGTHQAKLWEDFFRAFGLTGAVTLDPLYPAADGPGGEAPIGLIPGSENNPEKRWPVAHWRRLIELRPDSAFILFGTAADRPITGAVAAGFDPVRVRDLAGTTDLRRYIAALSSCRAVVSNDTGGMHLANALGRPLVALFGPTNPVRTGPIYAAPHRVLQPPGCPPTGGGALADLAPESVLTALQALTETPAPA